jgi:hypothetical protein
LDKKSADSLVQRIIQKAKYKFKEQLGELPERKKRSREEMEESEEAEEEVEEVEGKKKRKGVTEDSIVSFL